jgi:hypothetical protein
MATRTNTTNVPIEPRPIGLGQLISTALALSFGISMVVAVMLIGIGMWLDR